MNCKDQDNPQTSHKYKLFAVENTYYDTNQTDKASHKEIVSLSPAILWIVNICERNPRWKKSKFYFTTSKNRLLEYDGWKSILMLIVTCIHIHRYIFLDYDKIIDIYASKYPRRMLLTLSWWRLLSYRNQSIGLQSKSMDWSLYDNNLHHERVN